MSKTILLPLDGSPLAERALPFAAALARRTRGRLVLIEVVQVHSRLGLDSGGAQIEAMGRADARLREVVRRLAADGIAAEHHVGDDDPARAILNAAQRHQADLIVMSTHGRTGLGRMIYGSVADQVLRRAAMPVLLVPAGVEHVWPDDRPLNVLVPLDGSGLAEAALEMAEQLSQAYAAQLALLRVVEPPAPPIYGDGYVYIPFDEEAELAEARRYLEGHAARLRAQGMQVTTDVALGVAGQVIETAARSRSIDVISMATHGRGGLARLVLGSVAADTLRRTTLPPLLVRPSAMQPAQLGPAGERDATHEDVATAASSAQTPAPTIDVRLTAEDVALIERGLRALAYAPGYEYADVLAARALATALHEATIDAGHA